MGQNIINNCRYEEVVVVYVMIVRLHQPGMNYARTTQEKRAYN